MITRRKCLTNLGALGILPLLPVSNMRFAETTLSKRPIPGSGEMLPIVGVGTWQTFDVGTGENERSPLQEVLKTMVEKGASVIDSSPMYGQSEKVAGELSASLGLNGKLFIATKVWTTGEDAGIKQMNNSFTLLKRKQMDLMQIHNLVDWKTHLKTLLKWKEEGKVRYIGLTHYTDSSHATLASIIKNNRVDFVQVNYNLLDRHAETELLPVAQEYAKAVIINRPFEEGALFQRVKGKTLPAWAVEFDCTSWAQFFLKFILSHPAVTCAIPGTSKVTHLLDNLQAAVGRLPDADQRKKMIQTV